MSPLRLVPPLHAAALIALAAAPPVHAQRRPPAELTVGHEIRLKAADGASLRGELLGLAGDSLFVLGASGPEGLPLASMRELEVARHGFGWARVASWAALGALVSGLGMAAACSQVDDADCAGVVPGVALSWAIFGGVFGAVMQSQRWRAVGVDEASLRPYARYPQGIPREVR